MRQITISRQLAAAAVGAIAASQTTAGAGNLTINGTLASNGIATLDVQRTVGITSGGNDSAVTFTIFGTDGQGRVISESLAGPNANTVSSVLNYLTVTRIAVNAAVASAVTVDTVGTGASQEIVLDQYLKPFSVGIAAELASGSANFTVQYTLDNVFGSSGPFSWFTAIAAGSVTVAGSQTTPATALRLLTNSGTGLVNLIVAQAGLIG